MSDKPSFITRVTSGVKGFISGVKTGQFFGPEQPIQQQEPEAQRTWDYPIGVNLNYVPRSTDIYSFENLRRFSDMYDICRLAIERRKDQIGALSFVVQSRRGRSGSVRKANAIADKLQYPDNFNNWSDWVRILIEDILVIDAATIYPVLKRNKDVQALEIWDGATINRLVDYRGKTPMPPNPAYQQVIKGIPTVNFSADELIYSMRNKRSYRLYGFSPVEQIVMTINIALNRQYSQLVHFTKGNVPEGIVTMPENWFSEQIEDYQTRWNTWLTGDIENKSGVVFAPDGTKYQPFKEAPMKNEFDEWLARIVCFAFGLPPTAFVKEMNRSTAEASQATAESEGLGPLKQWVKEKMDFIIAKYFQAPELEFVWQPVETEQDPLTKAQVFATYIKAGVLLPDEVRAEIGKEPLTDEQLNRQTQVMQALNHVQQNIDNDDQADNAEIEAESSQSSS